ncbi:hypothetical protein DL96DRAFT_1563193 [Flagelloscypha sp. PMI_526]|nr:hypothetical protein DL96DRAFT_1563193 [Flagelloscypha sp. PMI_526]
MESDLPGEDVCPADMFNIIGGTGIGGQATQSHLFLERRLFRSEVWNRKVQRPCVEVLNAALDEILLEITEVETSLDSLFEEKNPKTMCSGKETVKMNCYSC